MHVFERVDDYPGLFVGIVFKRIERDLVAIFIIKSRQCKSMTIHVGDQKQRRFILQQVAFLRVVIEHLFKL